MFHSLPAKHIRVSGQILSANTMAFLVPFTRCTTHYFMTLTSGLLMVVYGHNINTQLKPQYNHPFISYSAFHAWNL